MSGFELAYYALLVIGVCGAPILLIGAGRRVFRFRQTTLRIDVLDDMADLLLKSLRPYSAGPDRPIPLSRTFWPSFGWTHVQVLRVLEYTMSRGWLILPDFEIRRDGVLWSRLPMSAALTPSSYEMFSEPRQSMIINGPSHFGNGDLVNTGSSTLVQVSIEQSMSELALDVYREARTHTGDLARQLEQAADALSQAVKAGTPRASGARGHLKWLADFANDTATGVVSGAIVAAATALLARL